MDDPPMKPRDVFTDDDVLRQWMHQIMMVSLRGLVGILVPRLRVEKVLLVFTHSCARLICEFYAGDEVSVHKMRKACREMFFETTKKMPVVPLTQQPIEQTDTAVNLR